MDANKVLRFLFKRPSGVLLRWILIFWAIHYDSSVNDYADRVSACLDARDRQVSLLNDAEVALAVEAEHNRTDMSAAQATRVAQNMMLRLDIHIASAAVFGPIQHWTRYRTCIPESNTTHHRCDLLPTLSVDVYAAMAKLIYAADTANKTLDSVDLLHAATDHIQLVLKHLPPLNYCESVSSASCGMPPTVRALLWVLMPMFFAMELNILSLVLYIDDTEQKRDKPQPDTPTDSPTTRTPRTTAPVTRSQTQTNTHHANANENKED